ncbi:hypothetical protein Celaphus_00015172 [Cervus elaphus hippelaphus]|uniref:Uncharacterized protein n=1 Tax=Cervus elaphus hippelaphus TaxID=46360 RepID=A0A212CSB7_CEREH|nr:hypothetical protein Celaphus_00015172 [Cervus elaphus hippelaphus]
MMRNKDKSQEEDSSLHSNASSADRHTALHCVLAKQQEVAVRSSKAGRRRRRLLIGCARAWQQRVNSGGLRAGSAP